MQTGGEAELLLAESSPCACLPDAPHSVQRIGEPFNDRLEGFLSRATARTAMKEQRHAQA